MAGPGVGTRSWNSWRSPLMVSDCQSTDLASVSKILSRDAPERAIEATRGVDARFIVRTPHDRREHF